MKTPSIKTYSLELTAFICGSIVMIYELAGSRIIAPYLGNSIYSWSTLIGVILLSLSCGYWYGGRLADKKASTAALSKIILAAAVCITITLIIQPILLISIQNCLKYHIFSLGLSLFLADFILFAPAGFFLGIVSPYTVKLKMEKLEKAGKTVGNLYAIGTIGSIAGTFTAGYLLIPFFGTTVLIGLMAVTLVILSAALHPQNLKDIKTSAVYIAVLIVMALFFLQDRLTHLLS